MRGPRATAPPEATEPSADLVDTGLAGPAAMRGGILRTASFAGGLLVTLASAPLLIRYLGDGDFGRYSAVLAVIGIVGGLTEGGVNTIALRELSATSDGAERSRMMRDLVGLRLVLSLAGLVVAVGFAALAGYGGPLVIGTLLAGLGMLITLTQTLMASVLQSRLRFGWAALIEFGRQALTAVLIVGLVLSDAGVVAFLAVAVPAGLSALIPTILLVRGSVSLSPAFHPRHWVPLLRDTVVFAAAVAINTLYFRVTLVITSLVATAVETGYFAVSYRVIEVLIGIPVLLIGAAFPIIARSARRDKARFEFASGRLFELGVLAGAFSAVCLFLAAPFAIELLVGSDDHPSVRVLQIQSAALLASFVAAATGYPLLGIGRYRETLLANCLSLVLATGLALALVPAGGARGAAIAAVTADGALAVANTALLVRAGGPRLPMKVLPVALIAGAAAVAAGMLIGVHPLVEAATGAAVFLITIAALGRFPPEVRELLSRRSPTTKPETLG